MPSIVYLLSITILLFCSPVHAKQEPNTNDETTIQRIIDDFLESESSTEFMESASEREKYVIDLDNDDETEIILLWTRLGPTYWHNQLTIFSQINGKFEPKATQQLVGIAKIHKIEKNSIVLDLKLPAKNDPRCCPSIEKQTQFIWLNRELIEKTY